MFMGLRWREFRCLRHRSRSMQVVCRDGRIKVSYRASNLVHSRGVEATIFAKWTNQNLWYVSGHSCGSARWILMRFWLFRVVWIQHFWISWHPKFYPFCFVPFEESITIPWGRNHPFLWTGSTHLQQMTQQGWRRHVRVLVAQNDGKVWISGEKILSVSFHTISNHFFYGPEKY